MRRKKKTLSKKSSRMKITCYRTGDLQAGFIQNIFVIDILPQHQVFQNLEKPLAFLVSRVFIRHVLGWVIHQRRPQHRPSGRQQPARPPQVQREGVSVPAGFLARRFLV